MKVSEIFASIQGESTYAGLPCLFIRLSGCNLRCSYCDSVDAFSDGMEMSVGEIIAEAREHVCDLVEITGGEPLMQEETPQLAVALTSHFKGVLVETNGSMDICSLTSPIIRIIDIKCPASGESGKMRWDNLNDLRVDDELKFVISNREDFDWAVSVLTRYNLIDKHEVLFSPAYQVMPPDRLASWIMKSQLPLRLQLQIHKYIGVR
ncbi:MAG: radical SAM protein [candidate division KSB1 bacterium]|nr:radical SAM protein [candidate division KSB1 bacterium]